MSTNNGGRAFSHPRPIHLRDAVDREVAYTECKTFGHWWDHFIATNLPAASLGFERLDMLCTRCTSERYAEVNLATGDLATPYDYWHPDDYADVGVKLTKSEMRKLFLGAEVEAEVWVYDEEVDEVAELRAQRARTGGRGSRRKRVAAK
jgi:hypothetical protein